MPYGMCTFSDAKNLNARTFQGLWIRDHRLSGPYLHCRVILWAGVMDVNVRVTCQRMEL